MSGNRKAQSAVEYLSTYGWVFLVLSLVIAVLWYLGVFSQAAFTIRAQPGSCQVLRPGGTLSTQFVSLQGVCNNQVPEYVSTFVGSNSYFDIEQNISLSGNAVSITAWIKITTTTTGFNRGNILSVKGEHYCGAGLGIWINNGQGNPPGSGPVQAANFWVDEKNSPRTETRVFSLANTIQLNKWYFIAGTYNGTKLVIYINGDLMNSSKATSGSDATNSIAACTSTSSLGSSSHYNQNYLPGSISNVQLYATTLTNGEITELYQEGIGGDPTSLLTLLGWWPINGNDNDYSGNGYNGGPTNVIFTSIWTNGYSVP